MLPMAHFLQVPVRESDDLDLARELARLRVRFLMPLPQCHLEVLCQLQLRSDSTLMNGLLCGMTRHVSQCSAAAHLVKGCQVAAFQSITQSLSIGTG